MSPDEETAATEAAKDQPEKSRRSGGTPPYCDLPATEAWFSGTFTAINELKFWLNEVETAAHCYQWSGCDGVIVRDTFDMCFDNESYMGTTTDLHDWLDDIIAEVNANYPDYVIDGGTIDPVFGFELPIASCPNITASSTSNFTAKATIYLKKCNSTPIE